MRKLLSYLVLSLLFVSIAGYVYAGFFGGGGGGSGTGNVSGPASSTAHHLAGFADTSGKVLEDAGAIPTATSHDQSAASDWKFGKVTVGATNPFALPTAAPLGTGYLLYGNSDGTTGWTNSISIDFGPYNTHYVNPTSQILTGDRGLDFIDGDMRVPAASDISATTGHPTWQGSESIMTISLNGGGSAIPTGAVGNKRFKNAWTITGYSILSSTSCSCSIDLWHTTYALYDGTTHPVVGDSIVAAAPIHLTTVYKYEDVTLTGWTTTIAIDDIIHPNVTSCDCTGSVTVQIYGSRSF